LKLENLSGLHFEDSVLVRKFTLAATSTNLELADLLIAIHANVHGAEAVLTFDHKASRYPLFEAVP
jgi:hypothetical protein